MKTTVSFRLKFVSIYLLLILCFISSATAQDTTGIHRVNEGIPVGFKSMSLNAMHPAVQKVALQMAAKNGFKADNKYDDTLRFWSNDNNIHAVSFIAPYYEYTSIIFNHRGKWLQTTNYPNPEFREVGMVTTTLMDSGYNSQSLRSPIGPIIKYRTRHDTWYEAQVFQYTNPDTILTAVVDKKFKFIGIRK